MDIDHLGPSIVDQLVGLDRVQDIADLYKLTKSDLTDLEKFGDKSAENLIKAIDASKSQELWRLLHGLGIQHVGAGVSKQIARHLGSLEAIQKADLAALTSINEVGEIVAQSLRNFFEQDSSGKIIEQLERRSQHARFITSQIGWPSQYFFLAKLLFLPVHWKSTLEGKLVK